MSLPWPSPATPTALPMPTPPQPAATSSCLVLPHISNTLLWPLQPPSISPSPTLLMTSPESSSRTPTLMYPPLRYNILVYHLLLVETLSNICSGVILQADGSEIWIQSQRDLSGQFYGLSSQTPHAAAYLPTAGAPSSHMQFPSMYHHPGQAAQMASSHHLIPAAAGGGVSVGVGMAAPPPQVGSYQQPQVSHLNWTGNF